MFKKVSAILALVIALAAVAGVVSKLDNRWAKADQVKKLELRLDQKIDADRINQVQQRIWTLEDRYKPLDKMPQTVREEYRELKDEKVRLEGKWTK
jgi:predicted  nucleic acid-binding Zn-ribbon protein